VLDYFIRLVCYVNSYAPLLPYTVSLGVGLISSDWQWYELGAVVWVGLGCWIAFDWRYGFTLLRLSLCLGCCLGGGLRAMDTVQDTPRSGITSITTRTKKPWAKIETLEAGNLMGVWPRGFPEPSNWTKCLGVIENTILSDYHKGMGCSAKFRPIALIDYEESETSMVSYRVAMDSIISKSGTDSPGAGFLMGISTGDKSKLSREVRHTISKSGLAHILAVSGYHVGLVGFLPLLFIRSNNRKVRLFALLGLVFIWWFIISCGSPYSAVRSGIMISVGCLCVYAGRVILPFQVLSISAWIIMMLDPLAFQQLGTQLSFAATAGILCVVHDPRLLLFRVPIAATTATLPLISASFMRIPIWFLPLNVVGTIAVTIIGGLLAIGSVFSICFPYIGLKMVYISGEISSFMLNKLIALDSISILSFEVENHLIFMLASISGWAWLLQGIIPRELCRIMTYTALLSIITIFVLWIEFI
jgi:ComEC/Rec2-related protein